MKKAAVYTTRRRLVLYLNQIKQWTMSSWVTVFCWRLRRSGRNQRPRGQTIQHPNCPSILGPKVCKCLSVELPRPSSRHLLQHSRSICGALHTVAFAFKAAPFLLHRDLRLGFKVILVATLHFSWTPIHSGLSCSHLGGSRRCFD